MSGFRVFSTAIVMLLMTGVASGQNTHNADASDQMAALLVEVRELRAELKQATRTSIQMQLLVARLSLQEGRIGTLAGRLANVRQQLNSVQVMAAPNLERIKSLQTGAGTNPDFVSELDRLKPLLDMIQKQERTLQAQASELDALLSVEQGRWNDFNQRIDALESTLPATAR
jgi:chromosome segregation ATPase